MDWYDLSDLLDKAPLPEVARRLGIDVERKGAALVALCPFHDDTRPSLTLHGRDGSSPPHFHCFACNAHGNAIDLVKEVQSIDFGPAVEWLARTFGIQPTRKTKIAERAGRRSESIGFVQTVFDRCHDERAFADWCKSRGFRTDFLYGIGLRLVQGNVLVDALQQCSLEEQLPLVDELLASGLVIRLRPSPKPGQSAHFDFSEQFRDYFHDGRVVIPIRSESGETQGYAGRHAGSSLPDGVAKYLVTPGLKKGNFLFNADRAAPALRDIAKRGDAVPALYVVEGFFDALRLHALDAPAVALMGTSMSAEQLQAIQRISEASASRAGQFSLRVFMDRDAAGFAGVARAVRQLLGLPGVDVRWVAMDKSAILALGLKDEKDPDSCFSAFLPTDSGRVLAALEQLSQPGAAALLVAELGDADAAQLRAENWLALSPYRRERALLQTARALRALSRKQTDWAGRLTAVQPRSRWLDDLLVWVNPTAEPGGQSKPKTTLFLADARARLNHARTLAEHGSRRGELPCDEETWRYLDRGGLLFNVVTDERLGQMRHVAAASFDAVHLPRKFSTATKDLDDPRRKVMPHPADLLLQQLLMNELLTERHDFESQGEYSFSDCIPAVRWYRAERRVRVTGYTKERARSPAPLDDDEEPTLSFGYQVDMDVLEARAAPSDQGMFRPFSECWREYMASVRRQVHAIGGQVHVLRLDAKRYYDSIQRYVVRDRLLEPVKEARAIAGRDAFDLLGKRDDPAEALVTKLCECLFDHPYLHPASGEPQRSHETLGIPQGPVLSAWIGTIAMFPVDAAARTWIRRHSSTGDDGVRRPRVGYARYVDDIILLADSESSLTALRETVQAAAADLELTLLRKGSSVAPGSPDEVMQQLNEGRVLAASVPVWEPPQLGDGELGWGFGGDGADLNRQSALHLLRHPTLLDEPDKVHERVREALLAPDFRPADLGKCTRLLWWQIAVTTDLPDSSAIWDRYWERWTALCEGHAWSPAFKERGYDWLFAVEGLDQLLDRVSWFEHNKSAEWIQVHRAGLSRLAKAVAHGDSAKAGFFMQAWNRGGVNEAHLQRRMSLVWWKAKQRQPDTALNPTAPQLDDKPTPVQWFCFAASLLATVSGNEAAHPLAPLTRRPPDFSGGEFPRSRALYELLRGKQDSQSTSDVTPEDRLAALDMVISASKPSARLAVLAKFPDLLQGDNGSGSVPLPPIPGIQSTLLTYTPVAEPRGVNLVAYANGQHAPPESFYGCTLGQSDQGTLPAPLAPGWGAPEAFHEQLRRWKAAGALPVVVRDDSKPFHVIAGGARFAADMVDLLLAIQQQNGDSKELVPVVAHLAQQVQGPGQTWFLLGEPLSPDVLGASAWVRDSKGFLRTVGVPQAFARYWRVGCAVSDLMGVAQDIPCEGDTTENDAPPGGLHELEEYVIRQQLRKLRGKWISEAQVQHLDKEGMPTSARRALETLRGFPSGAEPKMQVLALLVTEAETRSMAMRLEQANAGGLRSGLHRLPLQVLPRLPLKVLQAMPLVQGSEPGLRGDLAFLVALARTVGVSGEQDGANVAFGAKEALRVSLALAVVATGLRGVAASLWGLAGGSLAERLNLPPEWAGPDAERYDPQHDYARMRGWLRKGAWTQLNEATPWQWMLALLGMLDSHAAQAATGNLALKRLYLALGRWGTAPDGDGWAWPFDGLPKPEDAWCTALVTDTLDAVRQLDTALGMTVQRVEAAEYRRDRHDDSFTDAMAQSWVLSKAQYTETGASSAVARVVRGNRRMATWTEARRVANDDLLSVHVVDDKLGKWWAEPAAASIPSSTADAPATEVPAKLPADAPGEQSKPSPDPASETTSAGTTTTPEADEPWRIPQGKSWGERGELKADGRMRIALFQWRIDETYSHPLAEVGLKGMGLPSWAEVELGKSVQGDLKRAGAAAVRGKEADWKSAVPLPSWPEHRRRRLLKSALRACKELKVELLVLPEVSVRPETVDWLEEQMQHHPGLAVLAGTYRFLAPGQDDHLRAPLTMLWRPETAVGRILFPDEPNRTLRFQRGKKYRAVAVNELFKPQWDRLGPLFAVDKLLEQLFPKSLNGLDAAQVKALLGVFAEQLPSLKFCMELICSELFMMTSPANIPPLRQEVAAMLARFPKEGVSNAEEIVAADLSALGEHLSISHDLDAPRRSILLVPAATSRTCDYWYAGQASVLASGTATVFCNAVAGRLFQGGSCFIGADSTAREKEHAGVIAALTPYHGWQKGVLLGGNGGALSPNDQALVVADLDPVHVVGGKPRPQLLPPPLSLVAYLPVVELLDRGKNKEGLLDALIKQHFIKDVDVCTPLQHVRHATSEPIEKSPASFRDACRELAALVQANAPVQGQKLDTFADSFSDPESLRKRLFCWEKDRHQQPHAGQHAKRPPPALVDFLAVDLTLTPGQDFATVRVPAWSREAGALSEARGGDTE